MPLEAGQFGEPLGRADDEAEGDVLLVVLGVGVAVVETWDELMAVEVAVVETWDALVAVEVTSEVCAPLLAFRQVQCRPSYHEKELTLPLTGRRLLQRLLLSQ